MRVQDVMKRSPASCSPTTNLTIVAGLLCSAACDALPVVDGEGRPVGIITHRDVCVALTGANQRPSDVKAAQAMSRDLAACRPSDDIHVALKIMRNRGVRHIPVVNEAGKLEGVLCMSDVILHARHDDGSRIELSYEDVMSALISIYCHCQPSAVN